MPEDDFYTPTDADALRMENELLAFEVEFLRARYADKERAIARLERAEKDLILLLESLFKSPVRPLLRLKPSLRELERRYLRS